MDFLSELLAVVSALAQLGALVLLVQQAQAASRELAAMDKANPEGHPGATYGTTTHHYQATRRLLGDQAHPKWAIALLVLGTIAGLGSSLAG